MMQNAKVTHCRCCAACSYTVVSGSLSLFILSKAAMWVLLLTSAQHTLRMFSSHDLRLSCCHSKALPCLLLWMYCFVVQSAEQRRKKA